MAPSAYAAAQGCSTDSICETGCINNTIDAFDPDCGTPEAKLYTSSTKSAQERDHAIGAEDDRMVFPAAPQLLCSQIKDGACETACEGIDFDCLCGDFECQEHESIATCPTDCRYEQNIFCAIIRDGYCDAGCRPFDADCVTQAVAIRTQDVQEHFNLSLRTVNITLGALLIMLCATAMYLMHKAFKIKKEQKMAR